MTQTIKIVGNMMYCLMPNQRWAIIISVKDAETFNHTFVDGQGMPIESQVTYKDAKLNLAFLVSQPYLSPRDKENAEFWSKCITLRGRVLSNALDIVRII